MRNRRDFYLGYPNININNRISEYTHQKIEIGKDLLLDTKNAFVYWNCEKVKNTIMLSKELFFKNYLCSLIVLPKIQNLAKLNIGTERLIELLIQMKLNFLLNHFLLFYILKLHDRFIFKLINRTHKPNFFFVPIRNQTPVSISFRIGK